MPTDRFDALIVGSGINSLVCAALLAREGKKVCVLERESQLGGCIRTEALTRPGFLHDTMSTAHPLFVTSPAYAELGPALHEAGLAYCRNDSPTGVLLPDGRHLLLHTSRQANIEQFEALAPGDGRAYAAAMRELEGNADVVFAMLGQELWSTGVAKAMAKQVWRRGAHPTLGFFGASMQSCRAWLETDFQSDLLRALLAPWVLHCGLGPESAMSGLMAQVVAMSLEGVGLPLVQGGNANTVRAFRQLIEAKGGRMLTDADVAEVMVQRGRAVGVRLADGREFAARQVVCNVTPTQLYGRLLAPDHAPPEIRRQASAYRYGKGNMQIHLALSEPPQWPEAHLGEVTYLHLSGGLASVSRAVDEAQRGLLPADATVCVAQPSAVDPSRAPAGQSVLWVQLPECPRELRGDALGEIATPADGRWNAEVRERYADRIVERIARQVPNLKRSIVGRHVISPADLEGMNINLVGGDPYSGECSLDQFMLWRPLRGLKNHLTPVANLWHIGASTHPGPGLAGSSGFHVARHLSRAS